MATYRTGDRRRHVRQLGVAILALAIVSGGFAWLWSTFRGEEGVPAGPQAATDPDLLVPPGTIPRPNPVDPVLPDPRGKIAFVNRGDIWLIDPDGTGTQERLTEGMSASAPAWSPDGTRIAFAHEGGIYTINADGTDSIQLTDPGAADLDLEPGEEGVLRQFDVSPSWSPDGTRIAFVSQVQLGGREGGHIPYVMNADGSELRRIQRLTRIQGNAEPRSAGPNSAETHLSWSPDGSEVVFWAYTDPPSRDGWYAWYAMEVESGEAQAMVAPPLPPSWSVEEGNPPVFSPDGTTIAFSAYHCRPRGPCDGSEIFVMNAVGSGLKRLTRHPAAAYSPSWSPDGTRIAFQSSGGKNSRIYVMNADGSEPARVTYRTRFPGGSSSPAWSPVSRS